MSKGKFNQGPRDKAQPKKDNQKPAEQKPTDQGQENHDADDLENGL